MITKKFTPSKLAYPLVFALAGLFGCNPEVEVDPAASLSLDATSEAQIANGASKIKYRGKHYIVLSTQEQLPAGLESKLAAANGKVNKLMPQAGVASVFSEDPEFVAKASKIPGVRSVVRDLEIEWLKPEDQKVVALENYGTPPFSGDNDRFFDLQWGHAAIQASEAWNAGARGKGVRIAVLDSGFDLDHPDLAPNIDLAASKSFVTGEQLGYALPGVGSHGTHTAGTIAAADNGIGIIGVAPEAQLILVKVLRDTGSGAFSWIIDGIVHATQQGADVINMSLGASLYRNGKYLDDNGTPNDPTDDFLVKGDTKGVQELLIALDRATRYATKNGVTLIASAGNDANNGNADQSLVHIPSSSSGVISISATAPRGWALNPLNTFMDNLASYSNYGIKDVQFAAPGGDYMYPGNEIATIAGVTQYVYVFDYVFSTGSNLTPGAASYYWSVGTSMAAPHATGVAALIIGQNGGQMDPAKVLARMRASADDLGKPGRDPYYGYGRLNALRAVTLTQ
ncbi:S8 family serine peptidase [Pontibacter qinzhouensis]|uniref:S8 family serine peptidase n=1 Tax=Pontibacter qinzhouensis TaxID=2603253 RepID=A0A5C8KF76_9BACT|nr:S8 family serine peptidase [Pontibacter qinzhouensis]TXK52663.1 S8 family serine peptidase [Pontibacter qinzhouensis]